MKLTLPQSIQTLRAGAIPWLRGRFAHYPLADQMILFAVSWLLLRWTMAPTIYTLVDSAEFAIGAKTLGIVHAPGYALYLMIGHLFTYWPVGDVAFRLNLFSVLSTALAGVFVHAMLYELLRDRFVAAGVSLTYVWSYQVWALSVAAEAYGPQVMLLALLLWLLVLMYRRVYLRAWLAPYAGVVFGLAVAMHISSVFMALGLVMAFLWLRVPWRTTILSGVVSVIVFVLPQFYFPVRYAAEPAFNVAGYYNERGDFEPMDMGTVGGVVWLLSAQQFDSFAFGRGIVPSGEELREVGEWLWRNYVGVGVVIALAGVLVMFYRYQGALLVLLVAAYLPYTYFFMMYGAVDREEMMNPAYLLWTIPLAYGLRWLLSTTRRPALRWVVVMALPLAQVVSHYPDVNARNAWGLYERTELVAEHIPPNAHVFGNWIEIIALEYLHFIEGQRLDLRIYNSFYFDDDVFARYLDTMRAENPDTPIVLLRPFLDNEIKNGIVYNEYFLEERVLREPTPDTEAISFYVLVPQ